MNLTFFCYTKKNTSIFEIEEENWIICYSMECYSGFLYCMQLEGFFFFGLSYFNRFIIKSTNSKKKNMFEQKVEPKKNMNLIS